MRPRGRRLLLGTVVSGAAIAATGVAVPAAAATGRPVITKIFHDRAGTHQPRIVVIHGTNLNPRTIKNVFFGDTKARAEDVLGGTSTALRVRPPKHPPGMVDVRVVTTAGRSAITPADHFFYRRPARLRTIDPATTDQTHDVTFTATGTRMHTVTRVRLAKLIDATHVKMVSADQVQATLPDIPPGNWPVEAYNKYGRSHIRPIVNLTVTHSAPASSWTAADLPEPSDAKRHPYVGMSGVDCTDVEDCAAIGFYEGREAVYLQLATSSNGVWTSTTAPVPPGVSEHVRDSLHAVSCGSVGNCVAVGTYDRPDEGTAGLMENGHDGAWTASTAPVPAGFGTNASVNLRDVDCTSDDTCVAVGRIGSHGLIDTYRAGTWHTRLAPVPAGITGTVRLVAVSCGADGACQAVGKAESANSTISVVETLSAGSWTAHSLPLPSNTSSHQRRLWGVADVSCGTATFCAAVGRYHADHRGPAGLLENFDGTQWTATQALPPDTSTDPAAPVKLDQVSCAGTDTCAATGLLGDVVEPVFTEYVALLETLSDGSWQSSRPASAAGEEQNRFESDPRVIACGGSSSCLYAGVFDDFPLLDDYSNKAWSSIEGPLPSDLGVLDEPDLGGPHGAWCDPDNSCVVVGRYMKFDEVRNNPGYVETRINN